ncbi:hypothetical protein [Exilibacterium tricleocarpae]|uniref:hypothetical protein n=1 Tax=Exilibacterium tricleocarpae TaxID=2591008 RepID=UPI00115EE0EC|nr:hypothetical protein [Exilibacterium tricleocarpae]
MEIIRWGLSLLLLFIFLWIFIINWSTVFKRIVSRDVSSWIPLAGGVVGALAFIVSPLEGFNDYWWVPFLIEWGCLPGFLYTGFFFLKRSNQQRGNSEGKQ